MNNYRLNRLFNARSNRCIHVAADFGLFNEREFLDGLENIQRAVQTLVAAAPEAVQLSANQSHVLQSLPGRNKPALIVRTDVANIYGNSLPRSLFSRMMDSPVEQALRVDAAGVVVNLCRIASQPEISDQCLQNIMRLAPLCERFGMPLIVEAIVLQPNQKTGGLMPDGDFDRVLATVRQAVELGADIVKADPTDDLSKFSKVIEVAGRVPVLARVSGRSTDRELLDRAEKLIGQGVAGIVFGRNIVQHPNPSGLVKALAVVIHEGGAPKDALEFLKST